MHYLRVLRNGEPGDAQPIKIYGATDSERFWVRVDKSGSCWLWTGSKNAYGYGTFHMVIGQKRQHLAHRVSYQLAYGPIDTTQILDHLCRVPACVNPEHLRIATQKQNGEHRDGPNANSTTGVQGVSLDHRGKYYAQVHHLGKHHFVGYFDDLGEAEAAVKAKRNELFTHNDADRA